MNGAGWAAASGLGFGVFQTVNRRAVGATDAYVATFLQLVLATTVLVAASLATADVGALRRATLASLAWFSAAGLVHFFGGWTFLNLSQQRVGAARTSPLVSAVPVFGVAIAAVTLGEVPSLGVLGAIAVILVGVYLVAIERLEGTGARVSFRDSAFGLATAVCWATSPVFVKLGLRGLDSGLLGVTVGLAVAVAVYGAAIAVSGRPFRPSLERDRLAWKLAAGLFVGLSVWARWFSLELTSIGVVLALGLLSVPVVLALSPLVVGRHHERVTRRLVAGAALVVAGSLLLVAQRPR
jgi:drug/metabolite transporter (DMT)-like permease